MIHDDISKHLNELTDYILYLTEIINTTNPPDQLKDAIQLTLEKVGNIIQFYTTELQKIQCDFIEQTKDIEDLAVYIEKIRNENDELKKFVDAAKAYPGFQC